MTNTQRAFNVVLALGAAGLIAGGVLSIGNPAQAGTVIRTAAVQRGDVQASVSATGNVATPTSLNLNFVTSGRVTEIDVTVGQHVTQGQVLAKLDDTSTKAALQTAQANVISAQQKLNQLNNPVTPQQAAANAVGLQQASNAIANAQASLAAQQTQVSLNATSYQNSVNQAEAQLTTDQNQLATDEAQLATDQKANNAPAVTQDEQKISADNGAITKDGNAVTSAKLAQTQGIDKDQQSLTQAQQSVASAQLSYQSQLANNAVKAAPPLPGDLATAQAAIVSAQATLVSAQQNEAGTVLTAPTDGTITALSGLVGQTVSGGGVSSSSSSSSSGSSGSSSGSGASGSSGSGSSSSSSSGSGFMTLINLSQLQVKASFSETDVARVALNQPATVSFSALPTEEVAAHVTEIDSTSTVSSNVVTYGVTFSLDNPTSDVKPGMTANVTVIVASANNVLHVPTAAVRGSGTSGTVTVMKNGKQSTVQVIVGVRGDSTDEIASGLTVGEQVVVATTRATSSSPTGTGTGTGRLGGLGGGGFGGGGGGLGGLGG
jgi:multidrug efflux pump subunit AcrA (membrane-fusion protein)